MNNIVYSTALKPETIKAYERYQLTKTLPSGDFKRNAAWIDFCNACEKENKRPLDVVNTLK